MAEGAEGFNRFGKEGVISKPYEQAIWGHIWQATVEKS